MADLWVVTLGTMEYREAYALQERVRAARQEDRIPDTLLLLEHPPVYTRGRRSAPGELPDRPRRSTSSTSTAAGRSPTTAPASWSATRSCAPTTSSRSCGRWRSRSSTALGAAGVQARTRTPEGPDYTGVWVGDEKIASIGVHVSRGVTTHGFAVNVDNDMAPFDWIVACGLPDVRMTRLENESLPCFRKRMAYAFAQAHGRRQRLVSEGRLDAALGAQRVPPRSACRPAGAA